MAAPRHIRATDGAGYAAPLFEGYGVKTLVPVNSLAGDLVLLWVRDNIGTNLSYTLPTGFTLLHRIAATGGSLAVYTKTLTATETAVHYLVSPPQATPNVALALAASLWRDVVTGPTVLGSGVSGGKTATTGTYPIASSGAFTAGFGARGEGGVLELRINNFLSMRAATDSSTMFLGAPNVGLGVGVPPVPLPGQPVPTTWGPVTADMAPNPTAAWLWQPVTSSTVTTEWIALGFSGEGGTPPVVPTATTLTGLTNGQEYTVTVRGRNVAGESGASNTVTFTPAGPPTSAPGSFVQTGTGTTSTSIGMSWASVGNPANAPILGYRVYRVGVGEVADVAGLAATVTGLSPGQSYAFYVVAYNRVGEGPRSTQVTMTTGGISPPPPSPPAPPPPPGGAFQMWETDTPIPQSGPVPSAPTDLTVQGA